MKQVIQSILVIVLIMCVTGTSSYAGVQNIIGASLDGTTLPPPTGACTAFNMTSDGSLLLSENTETIQMGLGITENSNAGFAYVNTRTAGSDTKQYKIDMESYSIVSSSLINTADVPDDSTNNRGSIYNPFNSAWTVLGRQVTAPCNISSCLHIREYIGGILSDDITPPGITLASGTEYGSTYDGSDIYVVYPVTGGVGPTLGRFSVPGYSLVGSVLVDAVNSVSGLANDSLYVYGAQPATGNIKRWLKSNVAAGATNFTPGISAGVSQTITYDGTTGHLYVPTRSGGLSSNVVYQIRVSDMTITGQVNLGNSQFMGKVLLDTVNNKLYIVVDSGGTSNQVVRVNKSTLVVEATFNGISTSDGPVYQFAEIDVLHQKIYVPMGNLGAVARIERVNLCS